ncbi:DUF1214 domain-containing protein [Mycobacterium sp. B14F4]|uniref:DUF1214 domain-containing protein n=1 Tax=Mycobacterium sp. B14F4 TaxID=3153565 RepID=UPI00325EF734
MATTPGTYARFIGRVGALAVALGIGTAVATTPGVAAAQDGTSSDAAASSSTESSDTSASAGTAPSAGQVGGDDGEDEPAGDDAADEEDFDDDESLSEDDEAPAGDDDPVEDDEDSDADYPFPSPPSGAGDGGKTDSGVAAEPLGEGPSSAVPSTGPVQVADEPTGSGNEPEAAEPPEAPQPSAAVETASTSTTTLTRSTAVPEPAPTTVTTGITDFVASVLSAFGFGPRAASGPVAPAEPPLLWALLGWVRREVGHLTSSVASVAGVPVAASVAENVAAPAVSPLATPEQLAAERIATQTANTLPVALMKILLRHQFLAAGRALYGHVDADNMAALDRAVDEYAMAAAFQQQLLDSMNPKIVTQVAPPHIWFGQNVPGSRILYDNPDTIYRFMGVNGASEYVITGRFHDTTEDGVPADVTFSVLEGLAGTTSSLLTYDDLEINEDGTFTITVSREPANGRKNHLQLTNGSTIIAARDTLGDWNTEVPMSLSIERVGGPPDSLFAQIGGFAFLGQFISGNPLLTSLVSLVPPLPCMPPLLRGIFTAAILVVRGANEQAKYMALATTDPQTGERRPVNTVSQPASNAEFLANQRQSNGHFQLADDQVLVLTIDPGEANYFVVPTYNVWTITGDYWNQPASLNNEQAVRNPDGTYTLVISPTDPGAANWVSTGGLNQGALAIRFQDLPNEVTDPPLIVDQQVMSHAELRDYLPPDAFVTAEERAAQLAARKAGFDNRWAPYPQP